jgi:hypothetical protein
VILSEGRFPFGHFDGGDAQAPHIRLGVVSRLSDDFRSHPKRRTDERVAEGVCQLGCNAKVGKLDFAGSGKEDVRSLDVTMNGTLAVKIFKALKEFAANDGDMRFRKHGWLKEVETRATG